MFTVSFPFVDVMPLVEHAKMCNHQFATHNEACDPRNWVAGASPEFLGAVRCAQLRPDALAPALLLQIEAGVVSLTSAGLQEDFSTCPWKIGAADEAAHPRGDENTVYLEKIPVVLLEPLLKARKASQLYIAVGWGALEIWSAQRNGIRIERSDERFEDLSGQDEITEASPACCLL